MKKTLFPFLAGSALLFASLTSFQPAPQWTPLLDKNLSEWETYISFKHTVGDKGQIPKDAAGNEVQPVGYNKDPDKVFTIQMMDGRPVLHISGEWYGCIFTKKEFKNYRLRLKVKWGAKKWIPRLDEIKDSGILYNSQGKAGVDYWHTWMLSQEFQVAEHTMGEYWPQATSASTIRCSRKPDGNFIYNPQGEPHEFGPGQPQPNYCQARTDEEKPANEWNELELICMDGKSIHIVNGKVVMAVSGSRYKDGVNYKPLDHGRIQLQSEAAELFYKDIEIQPISAVPAEYAEYFK